MRTEKCFQMILGKHQQVYQMWFYIVNQVRALVADKLIRLVIFRPQNIEIETVHKIDAHLVRPDPKLVYF